MRDEITVTFSNTDQGFFKEESPIIRDQEHSSKVSKSAKDLRVTVVVHRNRS
jgi:hypothetical protein